MKRILSGSIAAAMFLLSSLSGCVKTEETFHYVKLSQVGCSFDGDGNTPLAITVETSPAAYEITPGDTWVKAEKSEEDNTLILTVADNDTGAERSTVIIVTAGSASREITVQQLTRDNRIARYRKLDTFSSMGSAMSPSGKYVGGFSEQVDENDMWYFTPIIIDTETGEKHEFGPYPQSLYALSQANAITDQGLLFISDGYNGGQIAIDTSGEIFIPEAPAGYRFRPEIQATSADGQYWVGFAQNESGSNGGLTHPLLWIDGVPHELPMLDLNYRDEDIWVGVMARGISADGSIIYGTSWESSDFGMLYWVNNGENTAKPRWVGEDVREVTEITMQMGDGTEYKTHKVYGCICTAELTKISPSGKWIATTYRTEEPNEGGMSFSITQTPAFYNTETETTIIVDEYSDSTGMYVTDDGIAFIGIGTLGVSSAVVYDLNTRTSLGSMADWVYDTYGIIIPESGFISYVSPDGKHVHGSMPMASAGGVTYVSWYIVPPIAK